MDTTKLKHIENFVMKAHTLSLELQAGARTEQALGFASELADLLEAALQTCQKMEKLATGWHAPAHTHTPSG